MEAEQCMVVSRKNHFFSIDDTEERRPPQLTLQLWDNDLILHDDYLSKTMCIVALVQIFLNPCVVYIFYFTFFSKYRLMLWLSFYNYPST